MKFLKSVVLVTLFLTLVGCESESDSTPDYSHTSATKLSVPFYPQQTQVWCWAAVIEMVSSYFGKRNFQCQTLQYWSGIDCCRFPLAPNCLITGTEYQIRQSFTILSIQTTFYQRPLSWDEFKNEIDGNRPIILFYRNSFSGHVVVGFGYNSEKSTVFIHDPFYGTFEVPYGNSFNYNGSLSWSQSVAGFSSF